MQELEKVDAKPLVLLRKHNLIFVMSEEENKEEIVKPEVAVKPKKTTK
jgi:hypothetical protein